MMFLSVNGWDVLYKFINVLPVISVLVVLPILIVWLVMRALQHQVDKKTEIMMKAVENGVQLDPSFFSNVGSKKKSVKSKLMGYLTTAMVTGSVGLISMLVILIGGITSDMINEDSGQFIVLLIVCGIILAVGIAFFIVYSVGKKTYAKELAELEDNQ